MRELVSLLFFLICYFSYSQTYTIAHINASWNHINDVELPSSIEGAKVVKGDLEEQKDALRKQITSVPVVIVFRDDRVMRVWRAGISLKLNLTKEEIANAIREDKQAYKL